MKFIAYCFLITTLPCFLAAQKSMPIPVKDLSNKGKIVETIDIFFEGLRLGSVEKINVSMSQNATLVTVYSLPGDSTKIVTEKGSTFVKAVAAKKETDVWDEKIWNYDVTQDGNLATVITPYTFYLNNTLSHCGINLFQLVRTGEDWKIISITDTRRRNDCQTPEDDIKKQLSQFVDEWHLAAAKADKRYFDMMTEDAIYIGTDASERWTKEEFMGFAMPYFEKGKAWDFKTIRRDLYLAENGKIAWFEESLDTWMGECRSSGVLRKTGDGWKIAHYHLSVTVPNDLIKEFIELIKTE